MHVENAIAHQKLNVIELVGYDGSACVDRLVLYLTHPMRTPKLNKIILDPYCSQFMHKFRRTQLMDVIGRCREKAKLLASQISGGVDVVIL